MFFRDTDRQEPSTATGRWLKGMFGRRGRRVETYAGRRVHIELRALDAEAFDEFAEELSASLDRLDGVEGFHINGLFDRVVVAYRSPVTTPSELLQLVEGIEAYCRLTEVPLPERFADFPGGSDRACRQWTDFGADLLAAALGVGLKVVGRSPRDAEFDLAAFLSVLEDFPQLRERAEQLTGPDWFEFLLGAVNAFVQAVGSGPIGPIVDMIHQIALIRGIDAQREAWVRVEPQICPAHGRRTTPPVTRTDRPVELPDGPVEDYADDAWFASLGGFVIALADTQALEPATAPLFGGLPKAPRYGRDGFVAEMLRALADRDILVLDSDALACLDRIDTVVIDGQLVERDRGSVEMMFAIARRLGLAVALFGSDAKLARELGARSLDPEESPAAEHFREMQQFGACLFAVGEFSPDALRAADVAVGLPCEAERLPWASDVIGCELEDALFLIEAVGQARSLARQSVRLAEVGATLGTLISLRGVEEADLDSVKLAVHAASVASLGNGIAQVLAFERRPRPSPPDPTPWHALTTSEVVDRLGTDRRGLDDRQIAQRRTSENGEPSQWALARQAVTEELANPMTPLLGAAAAASAVLGSMTDAALVGSVVATNAAVGGFERYRAERAMLALAERETPRIHVRRGGESVRAAGDDLVVGDIVEVEAGDVVPVDCRILHAWDLEVDESALTGESVPVRKSARPVSADRLQERSSMLYAGTSIAGGEAVGAVVATGAETEARRHPGLEMRARRETGVEQRLSELTDISVPMAGAGGALLTVMGLRRGHELESLVDTGIGMAVAAIPEGLPLLATAAQLASARRLSEHGVVVRNPRAIEALGRVDILCADKTGTLTEGRIRLGVVADGDRRVDLAETGGVDGHAWVEATLARALRASPSHGGDRPLAHPTDRAIVDGARERGIEAGGADGYWRRLDELKFHPRRGYHGVLGESSEGRQMTVKGAPEAILELCTHATHQGERRGLDAAGREQLLEEAEELAGEGLRVLCIADRRVESLSNLSEGDVEALTFRGFVGLRDPARPTAKAAVHRLEQAGIRTLMITGDHPRTAGRIARDVGLVEQNGVLTGPDLEQMSDDELEAVLPETSIIARVTPTQKSRIVEALQRAGRTVAMAGDGANDASAIRLAEVGLAVGPDATTAARDAADLVLLDENIETMVRTVAEGRAMLESVRDAVAILAGGNFGEIAFTVAGSFGKSGSPLNARQLLLVNLMTDIAPSMAMALRRPEAERLDRLLQQDPTDMLRGQLDRALAIRAGATATGAGLAWSASCLLPGSHRRASTVSLLALVGSQLGQTIFLGNPTRETVWAGLGSVAVLLGTVMTPGLSQLFGCCPVGPVGLGVATGSSSVATGAAAFAERFSVQREPGD